MGIQFYRLKIESIREDQAKLTPATGLPFASAVLGAFFLPGGLCLVYTVDY
jgi:hypothetical protein